MCKTEGHLKNNESKSSGIPRDFYSNSFTEIQLQLASPPIWGGAAVERKTSWLQSLLPQTVGGPHRKTIVLVVFALSEFFAASVISLQAPFFPHVAAAKGATSIEAGFVFGIFELTVFIASPLFGAKIKELGPNSLFNRGILITGICCIAFGFLDNLEGRIPFIVACFLIRFIEAVGDAAFVVSSFTIIALEYPNSVATVFGTMETFYGLGLIAGPTIGGALYEVGGYSLPFTTMGGCLLVCSLMTHFLLSQSPVEVGHSSSQPPLLTTSGLETFKMLQYPELFTIAFSIVASAVGVGYLHSTLEQHISTSKPGLNKFLIGCVFILNGGVYALSAPLWGKICDLWNCSNQLVWLGCAFTVSGFVVVGPFPLVPMEANLWSICIGLGLFGLGLGSTFVSGFIQAMKDAVRLGYPDNVATHGMVSGLWTSMLALGFFLGASSGGTLSYVVGFRWGSLFVIGGQFILICMLLANSFRSKVRGAVTTPNDSQSSEIVNVLKVTKNNNII